MPPAEGETPQGSLETNGSGGGLSPSHLPAPDSAPGVTGDPIHGRTGEVQAANPEISTGGNHRVQGAPETAGDEGEPVVSILGPYLRDRIEALERSQEEASHIDEPPEAARARSTARLQIRSNEDGAFVYLGPSSLGATPLQALDVAPRGYLVKAIKEGCGEAARWIDAEAGGSYQIYLDLDCPTKAQTVSLEPAEPRVADSSSQQPRARFEGGEGAGGPARWVSFAGPSTMWLATGLKIPFRYVPPGRFVMGSDSDELGRTSDEVRHDVTLTRGFWVAQTEVTQGTWKALMGYNPSAFPRCGADCPVESVTWYEAVQLANKMSAQAGYPSCYRLIGCDGRYGIHKRCEAVLFSGLDCPGFRLPTEAEWEYAARSLATGALGGSELEDVAWSYYDARGCPQKVGLKAPNTWGLQDMVGNVWEWVWDGWAALDGRAATDPLGPSRAGHQARVYRGGDYLCSESLFGRRTCRAASREQGLPGVRVENIGVRLVRTADPEPGSGRSMSSR